MSDRIKKIYRIRLDFNCGMFKVQTIQFGNFRTGNCNLVYQISKEQDTRRKIRADLVHYRNHVSSFDCIVIMVRDLERKFKGT